MVCRGYGRLYPSERTCIEIANVTKVIDRLSKQFQFYISKLFKYEG
jgi:hypothetical protein